MEKNLKYGLLLQIYGKLLTERQRDIMSSYYDYDLSLAEISENLRISRQAVLNAIQIGCASLDSYESELKIYEKNRVLEQKLEILKTNVGKRSASELTEDIDEIIGIL